MSTEHFGKKSKGEKIRTANLRIWADPFLRGEREEAIRRERAQRMKKGMEEAFGENPTEKIRELRAKGYRIREIAEIAGIARSTAQIWIGIAQSEVEKRS